MYILVNPDHTVNYAADHPIDERLCFENVTLVEIPDKTLKEVKVGDVEIPDAIWNEATQRIVLNPKLRSHYDIAHSRMAYRKMNI